MSRHRDIRNLDYDEEYDEAYDDTVYGRSVDDEYGVSPGMDAYLYSRSRDNSHGFGLYFPGEGNIEEEEFDDSGELSDKDRSRHSSTSYEKPSLSSEEEVLLASVLDEIRNIVGEKFTESELIQAVLANKFELDASLNALLNKSTVTSVSSPNATASLPQREKRGKNRATPNAASANLEQLSLSGKQQQPKVNQTPSSNRQPPKPSNFKTPASSVIITTPKTGDTPRVIRGFDVMSRADNHIGPDEQDSKRSRSSTPIDAGRDKDKEKEKNKDTPIVSKTPAKIRDKEVNVEAEYKEQRASGKDLINLVVVGHVDAGKSTLMGHLLYLKGDVGQRVMHKYEQESKKIGKQSFMYAWVLDDTDEERSRGVTVDVAQRMFQSETKLVTLLDAPGHRDFIPNMITGAARADVAILVVDATTGAFEAGFESGGQTREHAVLIKSLGVSQLIVAINKLDTADWSQDRFTELKTSLRQFLKTVGFKDADVVYVPCSGLTGENLVKPCDNENLCAWYTGSTLIQAIDNLKVPERLVSKPVRMCISDVFKGQGSSMCVSGRLETGYIQNADRLLLLPHGEVATVKNVQADNACPSTAFAGDHVNVTLNGVDPNFLHIGDFLCDPTRPIPLVTRVQARIVVFNISVPLIRGAQVDFHYQCLSEPAKIRKLVSQNHKTTGQVVKNKPRALVKNSAGLIELEFTRPLCIELFRELKELGRFMLRTGGSTIAAGLVTQLMDA